MQNTQRTLLSTDGDFCWDHQSHSYTLGSWNTGPWQQLRQEKLRGLATNHVILLLTGNNKCGAARLPVSRRLYLRASSLPTAHLLTHTQNASSSTSQNNQPLDLSYLGSCICSWSGQAQTTLQRGSNCYLKEPH